MLPTLHVYNALSHEGSILAFTGYEPTGEQFVVVWDVRQKRRLHRSVPGDGMVRHLILSPKGGCVSA
ncbi:hypothetical protein [Streptomyces sp. NPDC056549]|uniref:hypothetical protein n=1 Tax=Streptomyces sp. NPDC056549 TaxID=3345864 RepID=UPI00367AE05A